MSITRLNTSSGSVKQLAAANLKRLLKDNRWSERQAAARLNLTQGYINRRTTADTELSTSDIALFAELFELEPDQLLRQLLDKNPNRGQNGGGLRGRDRQPGDEPLLHFAPRLGLEPRTCRLTVWPGNTGDPESVRPIVRLADHRSPSRANHPAGWGVVLPFRGRVGA